MKYVLESGAPFIVPIAHYNGRDSAHDGAQPLRTITAATMIQASHGEGRPDGVRRWGAGAKSVEAPVGTITGSNGHALVAATLAQTGYGERAGQVPRALDIGEPLGTVVAGGQKHALVVAHMMQANGGFYDGHGRDARDPMSTVTGTGSQQQLVTACLATLRRNCVGGGATRPLATITAGAEHHALVECILSQENESGALRVAAFLMRYYGEGGQHGDLCDPAATITTKDRLALVTVVIRGTPYVIVDIGLRMLAPRELYLAQGFPDDYVIDRGHDGRKFPKSAQVRMVGNSVSPPPAEALVRANYGNQQSMAERAA